MIRRLEILVFALFLVVLFPFAILFFGTAGLVWWVFTGSDLGERVANWPTDKLCDILGL